MKKNQNFYIFIVSFFVVGVILTAVFLHFQNVKNLEIEVDDKANIDIVAEMNPIIADPNQINFGILMYHHIDHKASRLSVRPEVLDSQIKYLLDKGYNIIKLSEAFKVFSVSSTSISNYSNNNKTLVLTFDDGYRDFYLNAYPILKKYNVPASLYIINQDIGRPGNVTWEMIKQMDKEGLVEIGAHTVNHKPLGKLNPDAAYYQMSKSKELLEKRFSLFALNCFPK